MKMSDIYLEVETLKRKRNIVVFLMTCIMLIVSSGITGIAETVEGDLSDRYQNEIVFEHNGVNYRLKRRATFALVICVDNASTDKFDGYFGILAVDDNTKSISVIELDSRVTVSLESEIYRLSDAYLSGSDMHEGSQMVITLLNQVLPYDILDHYIVFDMDGLDVLSGYSDFDNAEYENAANAKQKIRFAKNYVETLPSEQLSKLFEHASGYIKSDLKSGAIMKLADKAEKYERIPTLYLLESTAYSAEDEYVYLDEVEINEVLIDVFFEADPYGNN